MSFDVCFCSQSREVNRRNRQHKYQQQLRLHAAADEQEPSQDEPKRTSVWELGDIISAGPSSSLISAIWECAWAGAYRNCLLVNNVV